MTYRPLTTLTYCNYTSPKSEKHVSPLFLGFRPTTYKYQSWYSDISPISENLILHFIPTALHFLRAADGGKVAWGMAQPTCYIYMLAFPFSDYYIMTHVSLKGPLVQEVHHVLMLGIDCFSAQILVIRSERFKLSSQYPGNQLNGKLTRASTN